MVTTSTDDGRTWSAPRRLPDGILGPIKNKPVQLADGTIVAGSSTEAVKGDAWRVHVELSRDGGGTWQKVAVGDGGFNAIQPTILRHAGGRLQLLCRSKEMEVPTSWSSDGGRSWTPLASSGLFAVNSGSDAVTLADGRHLLVYNYRDRRGGAPANYRPDTIAGIAGAPSGERARWPLVVSSSRDGVAWTQAVTLDDAPNRHGYAYPAMIQTRDGKVHVTYTFNREKIKHVVLDPARF
jgi:predicted neuraminidase